MANEPLIRFKVPEVPGLRDINGRFSSGAQRQRDLSKNLAIVTQQRVVGLMRSQIAGYKRASASTGRLLHATADPKNTVVLPGGFGYGVGIPKWLDQSQAKYWRTYEQGSAAVWSKPFIGTQLIPKGRANKGPSAHNQVPGVRTSRAKLMIPVLEDRFVVQHEIASREIYRTVAQEPQIGEEAVRAAVRYINYVLGNPVKSNGGFLD